MPNWLQKLTTPPLAAKSDKLPVVQKNATGLPAKPDGASSAVAPVQQLPAASIVYAVAASALFVIALYFLLSGQWFTGFLIMLPSFCFLGFALHFLKIK